MLEHTFLLIKQYYYYFHITQKVNAKKKPFNMNIINATNKQILMHIFTFTCTLKNTGLFVLLSHCVEPVGYCMLGCFFFLLVLGGFCVTQLFGLVAG